MIMVTLTMNVNAQKNDKVFNFCIVPIAAEYRGGNIEFLKFLYKNIDVNKVEHNIDSIEFVKYGFTQTALVSFTINEDGGLSNIEVTNKDSICKAVAEAAVLAVKKSTKWMPAKLNGKAIKDFKRQPITFTFQNE